VQARNRWLGLAADKRGVAALEFALVAPLLLAMYFVTIEVSQGIETNKKLARAASTVADLITQQQATSPGQLDLVMNIGKAILKPYGRSDLKIVITAIEVTDEETPTVRVAWSKASAGVTPPCVVDAAGSNPELPEKLEIRGTFLIRVQACLNYEPVITWAAGRQHETGLGVMDTMFKDGVLKMKESYYLRPRMSPTIPCPDC
jgi:Flp pilus assembly protein TadG